MAKTSFVFEFGYEDFKELLKPDKWDDFVNGVDHGCLEEDIRQLIRLEIRDAAIADGEEDE